MHDVVVVAVRQKVVACRQSSVLERKGFPPSVLVRSGVSYDHRGDIRRGRLVGALHKQRKAQLSVYYGWFIVIELHKGKGRKVLLLVSLLRQ